MHQNSKIQHYCKMRVGRTITLKDADIDSKFAIGPLHFVSLKL